MAGHALTHAARAMCVLLLPCVARELGLAYKDTTVGVWFTVQTAFSALTPVAGGAIADRYGLATVFSGIVATVVAANLATAAVSDLRSGDARAFSETPGS
jgi:MFS family permease